MLDLGLLILDESIYVVEKRYGYCNS
jgi:hypothetical protein